MIETAIVGALASILSAVVGALSLWYVLKQKREVEKIRRAVALTHDHPTNVSPPDDVQKAAFRFLAAAERKAVEKSMQPERKELQKSIRQAQARIRRLRRSENRVGPWLRLIGVLLPKGDKWRIEEMMNHRNELRAQDGRVPRFHYLRLLASVLEIRWEAGAYPKRRVD